MVNNRELEKDAQVDIKSCVESRGSMRRTMLSNAKFEVQKFDSTSVIDSEGYKITLEDGYLKVVRGSFFAMKGHSREKALQGKSKKISLSRDVTFDESVMLRQTTLVKENESPNTLSKGEREILEDPEKTIPIDYHGEDESDDQEEISAERVDEKKWKLAMNEEMNSLHLNQKWVLVRPLKGKKVIGWKWTKPVNTPLAPHLNFGAKMSPITTDEKKKMERIPYANIFGALMYAMVCTRPDVLHVVSMVSRYMHNLGKGHWKVIDWILWYVYGTVDIGLKFERDKTVGKHLVRYFGSCYVGDLDKRRSTTSYVFTIVGGPICWGLTL
uniref:Retrovirus-related Pol polyprotein from transposon TNT 1-94 n=1 Tax=Cannabis sativa TaxID=3483 RepID=A0A803QRA6_CANSA